MGRVAEANQQTKHFILLCVVARLRKVRFVIENPGGTLIFRFPMMESLIAWTHAEKSVRLSHAST
eukprot:5365139-Lingulodinium_polyedra.AAC.1